jgi:cytokinin dehydrogenase
VNAWDKCRFCSEAEYEHLISSRVLQVRWIRAIYTDFAAFTQDQEFLVSQPPESAFDYIEGFVVLKNEDPISGWNSVPFDGKKIDPGMIPAEGGAILYYIELVKKFSSNDMATLDQVRAPPRAMVSCAAVERIEEGGDVTVAIFCVQAVERMLAPLRYTPTLIFTTDVLYEAVLNRLHDVEVGLASQGLWDVPHPWLNLFVPRSSIAAFDALVFKRMINDDFSGPILIYPLKHERCVTSSFYLHLPTFVNEEHSSSITMQYSSTSSTLCW